MLYLDQPVQVGFSYDSLKNFTLNLVTGQQDVINGDISVPEQNATFLVGTGSSNNQNSTAQGTRNAAIALWHFAQVWFQEFPGYHPNDSRISVSTESCKCFYIFSLLCNLQGIMRSLLPGTARLHVHRKLPRHELYSFFDIG